MLPQQLGCSRAYTSEDAGASPGWRRFPSPHMTSGARGLRPGGCRGQARPTTARRFSSRRPRSECGGLPRGSAARSRIRQPRGIDQGVGAARRRWPISRAGLCRGAARPAHAGPHSSSADNDQPDSPVRVRLVLDAAMSSATSARWVCLVLVRAHHPLWIVPPGFLELSGEAPVRLSSPGPVCNEVDCTPVCIAHRCTAKQTFRRTKQ